MLGDTISTIAGTLYGDEQKWPLIYSANEDITNPDKIKVGQKLKIPPVAEWNKMKEDEKKEIYSKSAWGVPPSKNALTVKLPKKDSWWHHFDPSLWIASKASKQVASLLSPRSQESTVDLYSLVNDISDDTLTSGSDVLRVGISPARLRRNANIIIKEFFESGYSPAVTIAALVNAWEESRWIDDIWGDNNLSGGLFQLHSTKGAGRRMTRSQIVNPIANTRRIISEIEQYGKALIAAARGTTSVADLSAIFARDIERPFDSVKAGKLRKAQTYKLFPSVAGLASGTLTDSRGGHASEEEDYVSLAEWKRNELNRLLLEKFNLGDNKK
jgi:hypothetical protein